MVIEDDCDDRNNWHTSSNLWNSSSLPMRSSPLHIFQSSLHGFFRVAQTDTKTEPFWRKPMVLPLNSGKVARSIVPMEESRSTCQVCHGHTWRGRCLGGDICHKRSCVFLWLLLACVSKYTQFMDPAYYWVFLDTLHQGLEQLSTLGSRHLLQHLHHLLHHHLHHPLHHSPRKRSVDRGQTLLLR